MKKILLLFVLALVLAVMSCGKKTDIDLFFNAINKVIYDFYIQESDSLAYHGDTPWLLNYDKNKVLLFNHSEVAEYVRFGDFPTTNHPTQYRVLNTDFLPDFSDDPFTLENANILYLKLDKQLYNLENMSQNEKLDLFIYILQKLYISHLKAYNQELTDLPSVNYPITNIENQIFASLEYQILLQALESAKADDSEKVLELLKTFYAIRINRWKSQSSFVQTFELSQEKVLGLSYYQAYQLLQEYEAKKNKKLRRLKSFSRSLSSKNKHNRFLYRLNTEKLQKEKLLSIFEGEFIALNSMCKEKSENIGFILASLYDYLKWDYRPETTKENFHIFLGTKLALNTTQIDSLYNGHLEHTDIEQLTEIAEGKKESYENYFNTQKEDYNLQVFFDHYTDDFYSPKEINYINRSERSILFPNVSKYKIKSPWLDIEMSERGFLYSLDRKNKNIQTKLQFNTQINLGISTEGNDEPDVILIQVGKTGAFTIAETDSTNQTYNISLENGWLQKFETMNFHTNNFTFKANTPGEISYAGGMLQIKIVPRLRFFIEEQYWEEIEELNRKLIERGLPENWLERHLNNDKFRVYTSVVRYFTVMPENQVAKGTRDQNWYKNHFGVDGKVKKGKDFRQKNREVLEAAEKRFGIHYELAMGILAIESDYGNPRFKGNFYTFPALVSQYLLLPKRQRFAVNELVALYKFAGHTDNDVYYFQGSYAGAAGWGQFIPTSMNTYFTNSQGVRENTDIYNMEDNIHSVLNYLNKNGLNSKNIDNRNARFKAIRAYNHSDAYANAVLYIYDELRKTR